MEIAISYGKALQRYPKQVKKIVAKIDGGKSKIAGTDPATWKWRIGWSVRIGKSLNGKQFFEHVIVQSKKTPEEREAEWRAEKNIPLEERINDKISRSRCTLGGGKRVFAYAQLDEVPPEVVENIHKSAQKSWQEDQRLLSLTPEERAAEAQAALAKLTGTPGFVAMRFLPKEK